ncbi:MAG TPA: hypothetical protein EYH50_00660 [Pyrodictium delaneyi]|uniref:Integral membrane protein n=1 Tax=Pyrodictium delaneyi TaxID=1273541 RepID=A0A832ZS22_9CREN|nr:hypothetical protein [Pyrodictium delaneyi]
MAAIMFVYEVYVIVLALTGVAVAEYLFHRVVGTSYLEARAELEQLVREYSRVRNASDKRVRRRAGKLHSRIVLLQRRVRRHAMLRLGLLTPVYLGAVVVFTLRPVVFPSLCCIPALTLSPSEGSCVTVSSLVAALAFLVSLPMIQYDLIGILMLKKARQ